MAEPASHSAASRAGFGSLAALAVAFLILVGLGSWQVERLQWKEALIAEIEARRMAPPTTVAEIMAEIGRGEDIDYRAVVARGQFEHAGERHFLATHDGQPGYYIYTPLRLADGKVAFVNRGFVPDEMKDPARRLRGQMEGDVEVNGLARARLAAKPSFIVPENEPAKNLFFWKDLGAMAASAGVEPAAVLPFFVDAGPAANPGGYPVGGVTQIDLPNNHLSYAVTWYGLAVALVVIAVMARRRALRPPPPSQP